MKGYITGLFWLGGILIAICAVGYFLLTQVYGSPLEDKRYLQQLADQLTGLSQTQAEALLKAQEVQEKLTELALLEQQERIRKERSERWLYNMGVVAVTVLAIVVVFLAWLAWQAHKARKAGDA